MTRKTIGKFIVDYLMLCAALAVSGVAAFYSINGLTSIFPGALMPVIIMGVALEIAKVITTIWLHNNWVRTKLFLKVYLCSAIIILMAITSIGIFGFLSKAHVSQVLVGDAVQSTINTYEVQIASLQDDQKSNQVTLKQLDDAITQVVTHTSTDSSAVRALHIRNSQQAERQQINKQLRDDQTQIDAIKVAEAPSQLQLQKHAIDVGPIKYIAALIYGDNPNQNLLERAVRWMIILLVVVFDPMAIAMLLAFTSTEAAHEIAPIEVVIPEIVPEKIRKPKQRRIKTEKVITAEIEPEIEPDALDEIPAEAADSQHEIPPTVADLVDQVVDQLVEQAMEELNDQK